MPGLAEMNRFLTQHNFDKTPTAQAPEFHNTIYIENAPDVFRIF
jgi:DNA polymerase-3 subunit alpha/error-prone DNA polymerase